MTSKIIFEHLNTVITTYVSIWRSGNGNCILQEIGVRIMKMIKATAHSHVIPPQGHST